MSLRLTWWNCLWLVLPLLVWNLLLDPHLTDPRITSDSASPKWLLAVETTARLVLFILPILLPLQVKSLWAKSGLALYIFGTLIYFATWMPLLWMSDSAWSNSPVGLLAPRLTPFLPFLGIALIGESWPYGIISAIFIFFHTAHGLQNLN